MFSKDDLISSYSRADALEDGTLINVSELAREAGYKYPVAITTGIESLITQATANPKHCNDSKGVLWDILLMGKRAARQSKNCEIWFQVIITGLGCKKLHTFKVVCGPGDNMEPVVTIMLPEEN